MVDPWNFVYILFWRFELKKNIYLLTWHKVAKNWTNDDEGGLRQWHLHQNDIYIDADFNLVRVWHRSDSVVASNWKKKTIFSKKSFFSILLFIDRIFRNKVLMWLSPVRAPWRSLVKNRKSYVLFLFLFFFFVFKRPSPFFFFRLLSHRCACPWCSQMLERKWLWLLANWFWFFVSSLFIRPSCFPLEL